MKALILQVSLCSTVEWFATFALLRFKEYLHQFRFAQLANKALSNTYFAILALLELCKIICFPSLCSGTKYISTACSACCANKVSFRLNFYGLANFVYMLPFTTRWIKKYIFQSEWKTKNLCPLGPGKIFLIWIIVVREFEYFVANAVIMTHIHVVELWYTRAISMIRGCEEFPIVFYLAQG